MAVELDAAFRAHMKERFSDNSARVMIRGVGRLFLRIGGPEDLHSKRLMTLYRAPMSQGMKNITDSGIKHYREWAKTQPNAIVIPPLPGTPRVRFPHPLFSDLARLGAVYGNNNLPKLTWGDLDEADIVDVRSAERVYSFLTGMAGGIRHHAVVAKHMGGDPLPLWAIEAIINSPTYATAGPAEGFFEEVVEHLIAAGADAAVLREFATLVVRSRSRLSRSEHPARLKNEVLAALSVRDITGALYLLNRLATGDADPDIVDAW